MYMCTNCSVLCADPDNSTCFGGSFGFLLTKLFFGYEMMVIASFKYLLPEGHSKVVCNDGGCLCTHWQHTVFCSVRGHWKHTVFCSVRGHWQHTVFCSVRGHWQHTMFCSVQGHWQHTVSTGSLAAYCVLLSTRSLAAYCVLLSTRSLAAYCQYRVTGSILSVQGHWQHTGSLG